MANDLNGIVLNDFDYSDLENLKQDTKLKDLFYESDGKRIKAEFANNPKYKKLTDNLKNYPDFYGSTLDKWEIAGGYKNDKTGYYSTTFYNRESNELFVVDRGTNDPKDYLVDASMHIGNNIPIQFDDSEESYLQARDIAKAIEEKTGKRPEIIVSGHSMGASEADYQFARFYGDGYLTGSFTLNEYGTGRLFYPNRIELYGQTGKYFDASAEHLNEIKRGLVSPFDMVSFASNHWGNIINPYSKDGEYSKDPVLDFFFHGVDKWKIFEFDSEGSIIPGEVNCKNLLKMMQSDPANLDKYLFLYGKIEGLPTDFPASKNLLNKFCEELKEENITLVSSLLPESISNVLSSVINNQSKYNTLTTAMSKGLPDPIAIDMDGDGIETVGKDESSAYFDLDKNGFAEKTGWIKGDDALLARDVNGDGVINDGSELFGDQTLKADGTKAATGFQALAELDSNNDGKISAEDEQFSTLRVWQDRNGDGVSQSDELKTLSEAGIKSISLSTTNVNANDGSGNINSRISSVEFADGETHKAGEFKFDTNTIDTESASTYTGTFAISDEIKLLPYLDGISNIDDLHTAMAKDSTLLSLVQNYVNETDAGKLSEMFDKIMYKWFGVDAVAPGSRGPNMDARQLAILEKIYQTPFNGWWNQHYRSTNVNTIAAPELKGMYEDIKGKFSGSLNVQTHLKEYVMLGAIEIIDNGELKVNKEIADFILNYQKSLTPSSVFQVKFQELSKAVKTLGSEEEFAEFVSYYATKGTEYTDIIKQVSGNNIFVGSENNDTFAGSTSNDRIYSFTGNDKLYGEDGNDILDGGKGDDYLSGGENNDTYVYRKGDGNDTISDWNRKAWVGASYDKVKFEDINISEIYSTVKSGNDFILTFKDENGASGEKVRFENWFYGDFVNGNYNVKIEEFEFADGTKWNTSQIEASVQIFGTEGADSITGSFSNDVISSGDGNDTINSNSGNDTVYSGSGDDKVNTANGNDTVYAGTGDDTVSGGNNNDQLYGEEGNDKLYGEDGNDILDGGKGDDYLSGGENNDTYVYRKGDGNDTISDWNRKAWVGASYDKVKFEDINISEIYSTVKSGNDFILTFKDENGASGEKVTFENWFYGDFVNGNYNVKIEEFEFADGTKWNTSQIEASVQIFGTEGADSITGSFSNDVISSGDGNDTINSNSGNDTVYSGSGDDKVNTANGNDTVYAGTGDDTVSGGNNNDQLYGEEGNDKLYGEDGNDILDGGKGDDYLSGGENNDTYVYRKGDGNDTISDWNRKAWVGASYDKVKFEDINISEIYSTVKSGNDFILTFKDENGASGEKVRFENWFYGDFVNGNYNVKIEEFEFADGTKWNTSQIEASVQIFGTEGADSITGSFSNDVISSGDGNDTINSNSGNDTVYSGSGDDKVNTANGNDTVYAGTGDDTVSGGNNNDQLYGEEGNDKLYGEDGNDILDGGKGDDYLSGGENNDTYVYRKGDGNDTISDWNRKAWVGASYDKVKFEDINVSEIYSTVKSGNDFILTFKDENGASGEKVTFENWFYGDFVNGNYNVKIEEFEFADGTKWNTSQIEASVQIFGTEGADSITGSFSNDVISSGDGNDTINSNSGNDTVYSGSGDDKVNTANGNDTVYAGIGDDTVSGGNNNDQLYGEEGNDKLYGEDGNDILDGGKGDDYLSGGENNDTYVYRKGDGNDTISDWNRKAWVGASYDKVKFEDINVSEIYSTVKSGNDFILTFKDENGASGEKVTFENWFYGDFVNGNYNVKIEEFEFADGTKWNTSQIEASVQIFGTEGADSITGSFSNDVISSGDGNDTINSNSGNDTVYSGSGDDKVNTANGNDTVYAGIGDDTVSGGNNNDQLYGEEGNDKLYGEDGNDILDGGKGDDYLSGGENNDTYVYRKGDGNDTISDWNRKAWVGASYDKVKFEDINVSEIYSTVKSGNDFILTFKDENGASGEKVTFENWFYGDFVNGNYNVKIEEFEFADGTKWNTSQIEAMLPKYGTGANDVMNGDGNFNTLHGGKGNDTISGKEGNDKLYGEDGDDTLSGGSGSDVIDGGNGYDTALFEGNLSDYKVLNSDGKQYVFRQNTSGNEIDSLLNIESLKFADQEKSGGYTNFTENDTLKYIASYQEMINQYGISDANGDWTQTINGANKDFVSQGYKNGLGSFDTMGYITEHKTEIESVFGQGNATEENSLKHYISQKKANG